MTVYARHGSRYQAMTIQQQVDAVMMNPVTRRLIRERLAPKATPCPCGGHGYTVEHLPSGGYFGEPCGCEMSVKPVKREAEVIMLHDGRPMPDC